MSKKLELLKSNALAIVADGKGILAADESHGTIEKRFSAIAVPSTEENRCFYRHLLLSCQEAMAHYIGGVILFEETLAQMAPSSQKTLPKIAQGNGTLIGIKVDQGLAYPYGDSGDSTTKGLEGLAQRLEIYREQGAIFAKWRSVIKVSCSPEAYAANARNLAQYAKICQNEGIVPIVEPEVLMDGAHSMEDCYESTKTILTMLYEEMAFCDVLLEGSILKPNMILPGVHNTEEKDITVEEIASKTLSCLQKFVPKGVSGVAFLSGGQSELQATEHLNVINVLAKGVAPWALTFSYGRALQASALKAWGKIKASEGHDCKKVQDVFLHRARMNSLACQGKWHEDAERE